MTAPQDHRPRVLVQLLPDLDAGGVERGTLEISRKAVQRGWQSWVISNHGRLVKDLEAQGGKHLNWNIGSKNPWTLRWIPKLMWFCREHQVDVLHARSRMPAWLAYCAWRCMPQRRRPVLVTTVHGLNSVNAYSRIMTRGERVIAVSETARDYVLQHYPSLSPDHISLVYRGVEDADFPRGFHPDTRWLEDWYRKYPQTKDARLLTLPGRITRRKGHQEFLQLIARMREHDASILGLIVGGWNPKQEGYISELKQQIQSLGIQDGVIWTGHRRDVKEIYAVSDLVFSLSNKPESFGRTVLEALCIGTRCVGLDHGGVGEILERMYPEGRLPMGDSIDAWASHCRRLLEPTAALPEANAFPLQEMLDREISLYEAWIATGAAQDS